MRSSQHGQHAFVRFRPLALLAVAVSLALACGTSPLRAAGLAGYPYVSPVPGSLGVSPANNVVLRHGGRLDPAALADAHLSVAGSVSGPHAGRLVLSDDAKTIVFLPAEPFSPGESVRVTWERAPRSASGEVLPALAFGFTVATERPRQQAVMVPEETAGMAASAAEPAAALAPLVTAALACDTLPTRYVPVTLLSSDEPEPGCLFLTPAALRYGLLVLDNDARPLFFRATPATPYNFHPLVDGRLGYFCSTANFVLDSSYAVVDSFKTGNGYATNLHEFQLLPDGHALVMSYDPQTVNMSLIVPGGLTSANVVGLIIQELDAAKNVVFQWRSWDHFQITDMIEEPGRYFTSSQIDYVHGNSLELDTDGNILLSSRHLNEITKIDRQTGDILWRFCPNGKNNQFTVLNDARGFSHQHDARRLPNGNLSLYDNGNLLTPQYSRAVEYELDEENKIATQVWEWRNTPDTYGGTMGSTRRLAGGGTLIGWGSSSTTPKVTEVHADGTKALELGLGTAGTASTYRAVRAPWRTNLFVPDTDALDFGVVLAGETATLPLNVHNNSASDLELTCFASSDSTFSVTNGVPVTIPAGGDLVLDVRFAPPATETWHSGRLYLRSVHGTELVAQVVTVTGVGGPVAGVEGGAADARLWLSARPNPGGGARTLAFNLPRADQVALRIYDLRGRLVATPFSGAAAAGPHTVAWDGRSTGGTPLHSGIYFARLTSAAGTRSLKLVNLAE